MYDEIDDILEIVEEADNDDVECCNDENDETVEADEVLIDEDDEMLFQICSDCSCLQESLTILIE